MEPENVVEIKHLDKSFGSHRVLQDFNLAMKQGENLVVLGKSGSGKSVLIKCMIGLIHADAGEISILGKNVPELDQRELDAMRVKVGFLFQSNALYDSMTVRENLEFPLRRHAIAKQRESVDDLVMEALNNVGLPETVDMMPSELSGGMRKRIALARTLILKPEIILYDEPTTGLDPITAKEIIHLILTIQKKYNSSSLIISHDMNCVRMAADRIVVLMDGKCYAQGTYDELIRSNEPKVKLFFE